MKLQMFHSFWPCLLSSSSHACWLQAAQSWHLPWSITFSLTEISLPEMFPFTCGDCLRSIAVVAGGSEHCIALTSSCTKCQWKLHTCSLPVPAYSAPTNCPWWHSMLGYWPCMTQSYIGTGLCDGFSIFDPNPCWRHGKSSGGEARCLGPSHSCFRTGRSSWFLVSTWLSISFCSRLRSGLADGGFLSPTVCNSDLQNKYVTK